MIAEFQVKPDRLADFLSLAQDDATHSVASEPGCRAFDVSVSNAADGTVVFYEVYDDRAAFDAIWRRRTSPVSRLAFPRSLWPRALSASLPAAAAAPRPEVRRRIIANNSQLH